MSDSNQILGESGVAQPQRVIEARSNVPLGGTVKRAFDIAVVLAAAPIVLLVAIVVAAAVKLSGPGPILYGHRRTGFGGRDFLCLKFRTMVTNGDQVLHRHLQENLAAMETWKTKRKLEDDPRVTPVGRFLRKSSLDEIPQLLNILRGEMSLVGPRPVVREELAFYAGSADLYMRTRPGLTGLWQISGRSDTTYAQRVQLDRHYVGNWSLALDLRTLLMTVPAVLRSKGAR